MKNLLKYLFAASLVITLFSCDDEDGFYNEKYVNTTQLINFDVPSEFHVGESVQISAMIDRNIDEPGFTDQLDIYQTTGGATAFTFSYAVEKQTVGGEWEFIDFVDTPVDVQQGSAEKGFYILAHAEFSPSANQYEFSAGVPITSPGNYRLSFGVNSDETAIVEFRSESSGNNISLNLLSAISGLNGGYYEFTVLP